MSYSEDWIERYSRHIILAEVGGEGQQKIGKAKVIILGAGGLGSPAALYLAAAGVGEIGIVDNDEVDLSNLQRQVLHHTTDIGRPKIDSASEKLSAINPDIKIKTYKTFVNSTNIMDIISDYDIIVDGTDNFPTRFLVNDAAVTSKMPLVHGAILRFGGQAVTVLPHVGPCYRCIFREPPPPGSVPNCSQAGILGAVAGIIGTIQATEVLKLIIDKGKVLSGRLLILDALDMTFRETRIRKDPDCPICGKNPTITELTDYEWVC